MMDGLPGISRRLGSAAIPCDPEIVTGGLEFVQSGYALGKY